MRTALAFSFAAVSLVLVGTSPAWADLHEDIIPVGDPVIGDSWKQFFSHNWTYDLMAIKMATYSEDAFNSPGLSAISAPGWSVLINSPKVVSMGGTQVAGFSHYVHFLDDVSDPLTIDWAGFKDGSDTPYVYARYQWNGSSWSTVNTAGNPYWDPTRAEVVPAPAAVVLGAVGLGIVGWLQRRVRKQEE